MAAQPPGVTVGMSYEYAKGTLRTALCLMHCHRVSPHSKALPQPQLHPMLPPVGEDISVKHNAGGRGAYGVFDGHGGVEAAKLCARELAPALCKLGGPTALGHAAFPKESIVDEFWEQDKRLGRNGISDGTTASVLLVTQGMTAEGDALAKLTCTLAWVGDSSW